jgi:elongation factor G
MHGDGEAQLREVRGKISDPHQAQIGEVKISFRETIRKPAEAEGMYIRHSGGSGNYGHSSLNRRIRRNFCPGRSARSRRKKFF